MRVLKQFSKKKKNLVYITRKNGNLTDYIQKKGIIYNIIRLNYQSNISFLVVTSTIIVI